MLIRLWRSVVSPRILSVVAFIAIWWIIAIASPKGFIPSPPTVFSIVFKIVVSGTFFQHMFDTLRRVIFGFGLAFGASLGLGILMGFVTYVDRFFEVWVLIGLTIPSLAWAVLALLWFGTSDLSAIFSIFVILCPLMTLNMLEGTKALDRDLIEMAKVFHFRRAMVVKDVVVPQLVPHILAATRFGFALGWKVVVIAEMLGLNSGVGYMISYSFGLFDMAGVMAWTIAFTGVMFLIEFGVFRMIERKITAWRPQMIGQ
jgi:NitT/TauT family transport system permease protein